MKDKIQEPGKQNVLHWGYEGQNPEIRQVKCPSWGGSRGAVLLLLFRFLLWPSARHAPEIHGFVTRTVQVKDGLIKQIAANYPSKTNLSGIWH